MNIQILIALFFCHWLGDYTHFSTSWMLSAKRFGKPLLPIFVHAMVHATLMATALSLLGVTQVVVGRMFFMQLLTHFVIDILKGKVNVWFPVVKNPMSKPHWYVFGFDQFLHAVVIIAMTYLICR